MVSNIQPNSAALTALQDLNRTNKDLETTQSRVSSGLKVRESRDNSAVYVVAQNLRGDADSLRTVEAGLRQAQSVLDIALAGAEAVSDLLIQLKEKALPATDETLDAPSRAAYNADFKALITQISFVIDQASFDDVNLLDGSEPNGVSYLADADATSRITLATEDISFSGALIIFDNTASLGTASLSSALIDNIETSLNNVNEALARIGATANRLDSHIVFVTRLTDSLDAGVGVLVDADLGKESARLTALQTKQQLATQSIAIANTNSQTILALFQG